MTIYPNSIDNGTTLPPAFGEDATSINANISATIAIENELGIVPSGVYANVRARLDILESRINNPLIPAPNVTNPFFIGNSGVTIQDGYGDPTITLPLAAPGSLFLREDGTSSQGIYTFRPDGFWHLLGDTSFTAAGDLSGSSNSQTVIGIQGNPISNATPTNGQVLTWNSVGSYWIPQSTGSAVTWASDLVGSTNTNQFIAAISGNAGAGGTVLLNITGLQFTVAQTSPTINQVSTSSSSATDLTIQAQGATGAGHNGGNLVLAAGTSGSATAGVVNIQAAGSTIVEIDGNKLWSQKGWRQNVTAVSASSYNTLATDNIVATDSTANVIAINLPTSPNTGDTYQIKDSTGQAAANNVTISGNGKNIDGIATFVINVAYGCITVVYVGSAGWNII